MIFFVKKHVDLSHISFSYNFHWVFCIWFSAILKKLSSDSNDSAKIWLVSQYMWYTMYMLLYLHKSINQNSWTTVTWVMYSSSNIIIGKYYPNFAYIIISFKKPISILRMHVDKIQEESRTDNSRAHNGDCICERREDEMVGNTTWLAIGCILRWVLEFCVLPIAKAKIIWISK